MSRILKETRLQRDPQTMVFGEGEVRRHDADNRVRCPVDLDVAPDDPRIGSIPGRPQHVADHGNATGVRLVVAFQKVATENWTNPEQPEEIPRDAPTVVAFRFTRAVDDGQ